MTNAERLLDAQARKAEIDRLRAELTEAHRALAEAQKHVNKHPVAGLRAENEALREAGEGLAKACNYVPIGTWWKRLNPALARWREVAGEKPFDKADL